MSKPRTKVFAMYSPSHRELYEKYFLPTLPPDADLRAIQIAQKCPTGVFDSEGWGDCVAEKLALLEDAIAKHPGEILIYCDVDIVFVSPGAIQQMVAELGDFDIALQKDRDNDYCTGVMVIRANERTERLFRLAREDFKRFNRDQLAVNAYLDTVSHKFLSPSFWNLNTTRSRLWNFTIPDDVVLVHANFTMGVENKKKILNAALVLRQKRFRMLPEHRIAPLREADGERNGEVKVEQPAKRLSQTPG